MCPQKLETLGNLKSEQKNPAKGVVKGKKIEWKPIVQQIRQLSIQEKVMFSVSEIYEGCELNGKKYDFVGQKVGRFRTMKLLNGSCNGLAKKPEQVVLDRIFVDGKFLYGVLPEHYPKIEKQ